MSALGRPGGSRGREAGFTIIEMLVVVLILAILAAIVLMATGQFTSDSIAGACKGDGKTVETAEVAYDAQHHGFATIDTLVTDHYLRSAPLSPHYTITADATDGSVAGTLTPSGAVCYPA